MGASIPFISIVMPVFNTADYIDFAIRNVVEHQCGNVAAEYWELLIIDDGSTDETAVIARQWQERYSKSVKVISTENKGVSTARNLGLSLARGTWIYFIDSDDILLRDSLIPICEEADRRRVDVVKFTCREITTSQYRKLREDVAYSNLDANDLYECSAQNFICRTNGLAGPPYHHATWSSLYRRIFLEEHSIHFDPMLTIGEDLIMTWQVMLASPRILYVDRALYLYHQRENSAMHVDKVSDMLSIGRAYVNYLSLMLNIEHQLKWTQMDVPQVHGGFADNFRYGYNRALCYLVLGGESLRSIYRIMKTLKALGGDVHPGRPRFDKQIRHTISACNKFRRWVVAYIIAPLCYFK